MGDNFKIINPGQTINIGSNDHLTQVQHKGTHVDIVDHFDHGDSPVPFHNVFKINSDRSFDSNSD